MTYILVHVLRFNVVCRWVHLVGNALSTHVEIWNGPDPRAMRWMRTLWSTHARSPRQSKFSRQAHLASDATIPAFGQLDPPPHRHRIRRFSRRPPTLHAWSTPPAPRRHDRCIRGAGPIPLHTPQTPFLTSIAYVARLVPPTCPQTPRLEHSDSWTHPLTHTANAAFRRRPPTLHACLRSRVLESCARLHKSDFGRRVLQHNPSLVCCVLHIHNIFRTSLFMEVPQLFLIRLVDATPLLGFLPCDMFFGKHLSHSEQTKK